MFHDWPPLPLNAHPEDWCRLMDLAELALQRMDRSQWSPKKHRIAQHLVMKELWAWYEDHGRDVAAVHSRMNDRSWSHSPSDKTKSSIASWFVDGWFPTLCTGVGALFLQLAVLGQVHRWSSVCRQMITQVATNPMQVLQRTGDTPQHSTPPNQNPMQNPILKDPILMQLKDLMQEMEDEEEQMRRYEEELQQQQHCSEEDSEPNSLDSFWIREYFGNNDHDGIDSTTGSDETDIESIGEE